MHFKFDFVKGFTIFFHFSVKNYGKIIMYYNVLWIKLLKPAKPKVKRR